MLAAVIPLGCSGGASPASPQIQFNTAAQPTGVVEVTGLPSSILNALSSASVSEDEWRALLRISVKSTGSPDQPAVVGKYAVTSGVIRFTPMFPFDSGRQYDVVFDPTRLPGASGDVTRVVAVVGLPAIARTPSTIVSHIHPSGDVLPANQLRLYINFSGPMGQRGGFDHVKLVDDKGVEVVDAFLPLEADFFNDDRTRYTVFLDPGRVKRGILPNRTMGRALVAGRRYTLIVQPDWRDAQGLPLKQEFRREFRAGPADERPLTMASWKIAPPAAGSGDALAVTFPSPLDHGLLRRALGVARAGAPVAGEISIGPGETRWLFTPRDPWAEGDYELVALSFLEDLAGNRIGRAFEVDEFERTDKTTEPEKFVREFRVRLKQE
jgi:hypothetical protein